MTCEETKPDLRMRFLAARRSLSAERRDDQDARVRAHLRALITERRPGVVTAYAPMLGEPGGPALVDAIASCASRLLLPVLLADLDLDWAVYDGRLAPASRGLVEPDGPRLGVDAISDADLVIAPGLAVARDGTRLGRGGGSYDRALARRAPGALTVVALYDGELVDRLPAERHDQRVDAVITPAGLVWRGVALDA